MQISGSFKSSYTYRVLGWLFVDRGTNFLVGSKVIGIFNRFNNDRLSMGCIVLSVVCMWYETYFCGIDMGWIKSWNLGTIFLLAALLFCNKRRLCSTRAIIYLLLFVLSLLISGLWAALNGIEMGMILTGIILFSQFALAFIITSTYKPKTTFINTLLILSLPLLIAGCLQSISGEATSNLWVSSAENLVRNRAFGFFGSPNILGSVTMVVSIASLFAFLQNKKWYYLAYESLALTVLVLTFSRSAWLGFGVGVIIALLIKNWRFIIFAPVGLLLLLVPSARQRLLVAVSQEYLVDAAIDGRIWSLSNAIEIFKVSPILGTGPGTYGGQTAIYYDSPVYLLGMQNGYVALPYADNQWLEVLVQVGIAGALFVTGFFVSHFVNNLRQYLKSGNYMNLGIIAVMIAVVIDGFFGNIWEFGATAVLMGGYLGLGGSNED